MKYRNILFFLLVVLIPLFRLEAHNYKFSETNEEMKDQVWIYVQPEQITIQYKSEYLGQIAPHIRNMIDTDADSVLKAEEVNNFFVKYKKTIKKNLQKVPLFLNNKKHTIKLTEISTPTILTDSLLAPFKISMVFNIDDWKIEQGKYKLTIDPKLFFINGNQFLELAAAEVDFTNEQEKEIARFLQLKIFASESIKFTSTYPGYIKKDKKSIFIYGVFYDETILRIQNLQYPKLKIEFTSR